MCRGDATHAKLWNIRSSCQLNIGYILGDSISNPGFSQQDPEKTARCSIGFFPRRFERFNKLKETQPGLKTLLAVGGWNFGTTKMTAMLRTKQVRVHTRTHICE